MPTVRANEIDIGYDLHGAGPPAILLHGATSSGREDFAAQIPLFSKAFLVHVPDARGHATTRWDAADGFEAAWLADDVIAFADALGLTTFHLVGFSMGAMTALQVAVRHPERLRTLTVIGITTQREPRASITRRLMDPERIDRDDPRWAAELAARHDPVQGPGAWRRLLPAIAADVSRQPLLAPKDLRRIELPAMVVCGDRDQFCPVDHAWGLQRQLPDARLLVVPDSRHEVMVHRPGLFNEAMAGFYRATESTARSRSARQPERRPSSARAPAPESDSGPTDLLRAPDPGAIAQAETEVSQ